MRLVLVYVHDDLPLVKFEKFGHVLKMSKVDAFLLNLFASPLPS